LAFVLCHAEPIYPELVEGKYCCTNRSSFSNIHLVFVIPPFALKQKVEPKVQGKREPLRASCHPRTASVIPVYIISLLRSMQPIELLLTTFSKPHAFLSSVTNC
jgi:hypothetical protein